MKLSNESRIDELMRFKEEFNNNLKSAYKIYEERSKTFTNNFSKKEESSKNISTNKNSRNLPKIKKYKKDKKSDIFKSPFCEDLGGIDPIKLRKTGKSQLKLLSNTWKPQFMVCDYFDNFKRLRDQHEMTDWEKVIIYIYLYIY